MKRWLNCLVFESVEDYERNVDMRYEGDYCCNRELRYSGVPGTKPDNFPAYFKLVSGAWEDMWVGCSKEFVLDKWEKEIKSYIALYEEVKEQL